MYSAMEQTGLMEPQYTSSRMNGVGMYTPETQISLDPDCLAALGFDQSMIEVLKFLIANEGRVTTAKMVNIYGIPYEQARDLKYMYDIVTGRVVIDGELSLIKHLRRMFGKNRRIGINNLALSKVQEVPRMAVVANIKTEPYTIYNSGQYKPEHRLYKVKDVTGGRIIVETKRKPQLKYGTPKKIDGELEIKSVSPKGIVTIAFDKKVCRLCNRFIIVASLKRPEFHHGLAQIICIEGTKVYVYAQTLAPTKGIQYNMGTQRVYDYGFLKNEIEGKLMRAAAWLYPLICGVVGGLEPANSDFQTLPIEKIQDDELFDEEKGDIT